jgi:ribonuclease J
MKVKIIKGTNQIGGCITEISSKEATIIIDYGSDLDDEVIPLEVDGLTYGEAKYNAVFITHNHLDHIGLIDKILPNIPIYVEKTSKEVYKILNDFRTREIKQWRDTIDFNFKESIKIKDITITPYIVDHSAFNSAMFLIEGDDNTRILYTGDYRNNGYKGKIFVSTLKEIGKVNVLVTEGTTIVREDGDNKTELDLVDEFASLMREYKQVFVMQATTNIDRITTIYKACNKDNRCLIEDVYMANITLALKNKIPNPRDFARVHTYTPKYLQYATTNKEFKEKYLDNLYDNETASLLFKPFCMNIRGSMLADMRMFHSKNILTNTCIVYSMWDGYKEQESMQTFLKEMEVLGVAIKEIHTSGHADINTIKKMLEITNPSIIIPIHTTDKNKMKELSDKVCLLDDNEEIEI